MRKIALGLICLLASLVIALPLAAQEGFPLKGSWLGDWGEGATNRNQVFIVFDWDGKVISGAVNPGTDMIVIKNASLNPTPVAGAAAAGGGAGGGQGAGGGRRGGGQGAAAGAPAGAPAAGGAAAPGAAPAGGGRGGGQGAAAGAPPAGGAAAPGAAPAGGGRGGGNTLGAQSGGTTAAATVEWLVHFEGDGKDSKGATVHYVADGKVENIGLYNRSISGTWVSGAVKGTFKITRQ